MTRRACKLFILKMFRCRNKFLLPSCLLAATVTIVFVYFSSNSFFIHQVPMRGSIRPGLVEKTSCATSRYFNSVSETLDRNVTEDNIFRHQTVNETTKATKTEETHDVITEERCNPINKIVFIKIHKTGSTSVATIFFRFVHHNNLLLAIPTGGSRTFSFRRKMEVFNRKDVKPIPKPLLKTHPHYDVLANHARYHRKEMEVVVPKAKYITILRDPVQQLESVFGYYEMAKHLNISNHRNPFETFMQNPSYYYAHKDYGMKWRSKNGQLFDLGMNPKLFNDTKAIKAQIGILDKEFDLVLLTEYFDESMILMKKLLCWSYDDILYAVKGWRGEKYRYNISEDLEGKIRRWNAADVLLYDHFNRSFWDKVNKYGPDFKADLDHFRQLQKEAMDKCVALNQKGQGRTLYFKLNQTNADSFCKDLLRNTVEYTPLLLKKMEGAKKLKRT